MIERRLGLMLSTFVAAAAAIAAIPAAAGAAVACTFTPATATVSVTMNNTNDSASLGRAGTAIQVNGVNCGTATVTNTDLIDVVGSTHSGQRVSVDLTGGPLAPGKTAETGTGAISEIEINADLRSGSSEEIAVFGSSGADTAVFGTAGARLNTDKDIDLTFSGLDQVELDGNDGADTLVRRRWRRERRAVRAVLPTSMAATAATRSPAAARATRSTAAPTTPPPRRPATCSAAVSAATRSPAAPATTRCSATTAATPSTATSATTSSTAAPTPTRSAYNGGLATLDGADDISGGPDFDTLYLTARTQNVIVKLDDLANDGGDVGSRRHRRGGRQRPARRRGRAGPGPATT